MAMPGTAALHPEEVRMSAAAASSTATAGSPLLAFFVRETGQIVRGRHSWWRRGLFIFALAVLTIGVAGEIGSSSRPWRSMSAGRIAFSVLMTANAYFVFALTNTYFAKAVSAEREAGSLDLLRITGLSPLALLVGKGTSQFARALLLLVAQAPLCVICVTLGGLPPERILASYALVASVLFCGCHVGVFWSVVSKTSRHASQNTIVTFLALYLAPWCLLTFNAVRPGALPQSVVEAISWFTQVSPTKSYSAVVNGGPWPLVSIFMHLGLGLAFLLGAVALFERMCERRESPATAATGSAKTSGAEKRRETPPRLDKRPLAWKEYYFAAGGRRGTRIRWFLYVGVAILLSLTTVSSTRNAGLELIAWPLLFIGAIGAVSELAHATSKWLGAEVTHRTLGDLAILPIRTRRILWEKFLGHLPSILPPLTLLLVGAVLSFDRIGALLEQVDRWPMVVHFAVQGIFVLVFTVRLSLTQPLSAFGVAFLIAMLANSAAFGLWSAWSDRAPTVMAVVLTCGTILFIRRVLVNLPDHLTEAAAK
jgi:hypothetical protein